MLFFSYLSYIPSRTWKLLQETGGRRVQGSGDQGPPRKATAEGGKVSSYREGSSLLESVSLSNSLIQSNNLYITYQHNCLCAVK